MEWANSYSQKVSKECALLKTGKGAFYKTKEHRNAKSILITYTLPVP